MKVTPLLLIGSLVANVVLLALLFAEKKSATSVTIATPTLVVTPEASAKPATATPVSRESRQARQAALDEEVRRVLGPERFAEFEETRRR